MKKNWEKKVNKVPALDLFFPTQYWSFFLTPPLISHPSITFNTYWICFSLSLDFRLFSPTQSIFFPPSCIYSNIVSPPACFVPFHACRFLFLPYVPNPPAHLTLIPQTAHLCMGMLWLVSPLAPFTHVEIQLPTSSDRMYQIVSDSFGPYTCKTDSKYTLL